jgi:pantetheine-phosphate adenylyltransferase
MKMFSIIPPMPALWYPPDLRFFSTSFQRRGYCFFCQQHATVTVMVKAVFPGTFDPPTQGHCNIIERVAPLFDEVVVIIAENRRKAQLFSPAERLSLLTELVAAYPNVSVMLCDSLIVHCMRAIGARVIIRGIRGIADFSYEEEIALVNRLLEPRIETFFITADPACRALSSSAVKEILSFGGDISALVPPSVKLLLLARNAAHPCPF